ncbi:MAG TPA: phosphopentomutase [bacterium]|nr:phosphopentomutase [bacterium]
MAKAAIIVLDGVGAGGAPDAASFGDEGSNTIANTAVAVGGLHLPEFARLGLGNVIEIQGVPRTSKARASWGKMRPASAGKDTTSGHWEISGVLLDRPMPTYPHGFPPEVMAEFERIAGRPALGNVAASGTEILSRLGPEHERTARPIVYTSADSVFQIAAHEQVIPIDELYRICREMRAALTGEHAVGRVIARPFIGQAGVYTRTDRRRDFSRLPPRETILDLVKAAGHEVVSVGKIDDIFAQRGITRSHHVLPNMQCVDATIEALSAIRSGLVFTNLIEFDMNFGHRNDPQGMAKALQELDARVLEILDAAGKDTLLFFTADHGNDPTTGSTDHSREEVPLLVWSGGRGVDLGVRSTFADLGATVGEVFGVGAAAGTSFLGSLPGGGESGTLAA